MNDDLEMLKDWLKTQAELVSNMKNPMKDNFFGRAYTNIVELEAENERLKKEISE